MVLALLLNVLGLCIGLMSALFFSVGAITMSPAKIQKVSASYWDANEHWGDSLADQRADYIVGAFLLLLSFSLQLVGSLIPPTVEVAFLLSISHAGIAIAATIMILLTGAIFLKKSIASNTKVQVREIQAAILASEESVLEIKQLKA